MTDKPSLTTIMRWISHYAEDTATLHWYDRSDCPAPDRDEKQAFWRGVVDRRRNEVETALRELVAGDPGLHMRIADAVQREFEDSVTPHGTVADARFLGERVAHTLCAEIPEIARAAR